MLRVLPRCTCRNASATSLPRFRPFSSTRPAFASSVPVSLNGRRYRVAIVGAGPAGFYAASRLLGTHGAENVRVDMYEELPVPFGLVRYGVAPDHPEVKVSHASIATAIRSPCSLQLSVEADETEPRCQRSLDLTRAHHQIRS